MSFTQQLSTLFARHEEFLAAIEQRATDLDLATHQLLNGFKDNAITMYVDPVNGSDANNGLSVGNSLQSLDRVFELAFDNTAINIILLGNVTLERYHVINASVLRFTGLNAAGAPVNRTITPLAEATNSPNGIGQKRIGAVEARSKLSIEGIYINFVVPTVANDVVLNSVFAGNSGTDMTLRACSIDTPFNAGIGKLLGSYFPSPISYWESGVTRGVNMAGRMIAGVGAGQNPSAISARFRSNATSL